MLPVLGVSQMPRAGGSEGWGLGLLRGQELPSKEESF